MSVVATNHTGRAIVVIGFDDGDATVHSAAYPILAANNLRGTAYIVPTLIDAAGGMTTAQLQELYAAGWDIGSHTNTHAYLTELTEAQQEAELSVAHDWLVTNSMPRAAHHVAYPWGQSNADTLTAMTAAGMLTGRTIAGGLQGSPPVNPLLITSRIPSTEALATMTGWIDAAVAASSCQILCLHKTGSGTGDYVMSTENFAALMAYIRAADCEVMTISEWYANLSGAVTLTDDLTKGAGSGHGSGFYVPTKYGSTWTKGPWTYLT